MAGGVSRCAVLFEGLYAHQSADDHGRWWQRIVRLVQLTGHLEPSDGLYGVIAQDVGACTLSYLRRDLAAYRWHVERILDHLLRAPKGQRESHPNWS